MLNMLHIKDSKNLFEFTDYFKSPTKAFSNIVKVFDVYFIFHYKQYIQL